MKILKNTCSILLCIIMSVLFSACSATDGGNNSTSNMANEPSRLMVNEQENTIENKSITVTKSVVPSGFAGASLHNLILYSNGDVYLDTHSGESNDDKDIISRELIAKNAIDLAQEEDMDGIIVVRGKKLQVNNQKYLWITFENEK